MFFALRAIGAVALLGVQTLTATLADSTSNHYSRCSTIAIERVAYDLSTTPLTRQNQPLAVTDSERKNFFALVLLEIIGLACGLSAGFRIGRKIGSLRGSLLGGAGGLVLGIAMAGYLTGQDFRKIEYGSISTEFSMSRFLRSLKE